MLLECQTLEGETCKFPFTFEGYTYNNCTFLHNTNPFAYSKLWCPTQLDSEEEYAGKWGNCDDSCTLQ